MIEPERLMGYNKNIIFPEFQTQDKLKTNLELRYVYKKFVL